jgi:TRAP-type uncharacterized transport system substrate-binding protein
MSLVQKLLRMEFVLLTHQEQKRLLWLALGLLALLLWLLFGVIEPPPPKTIRIATGSPNGAYTLYAKQYALALKKHGVKLEIVNSAGSLDNLQRLNDPAQKIDLAFVQGGVADAEKHPGIEALASVAYEPIWVFYNPRAFANGQVPKRLGDFAGKRVAIDVAGSGTRAAAEQLLAMNQLQAQAINLLPAGGVQAIEAVQTGAADAAILVAAVASPAVQQALVLAASSNLGLMNFDNADAYTRLLPWVAKVNLPKGVASLANNLPREDVSLIAATANLVARKDLHRAIMFLVMEVAHDIHKTASATNARGEFPSERNLDYVQSDESKRFFVSGRPFLEQYLPFWLANFAERALVTLVPLLAIGLPLLKIIPSYIHWREYAEVVQLYDEVLALEHTPCTNASERHTRLQRLSEIDQALHTMHLGAENHINVYNLKSHIDLVKQRLRDVAPSLA